MYKPRLIISLLGYSVLVYLLYQAAAHLYTPTRTFDMPSLLWLTHLFILYIHEAGHFFFRIFGETLYIMGGSLFQVIVPIVWFVVAKREGSSLSNVALFFIGISAMDVSIYMKDAEQRLLPLISGLSKTHHDWWRLFVNWDAIELAYPLGETLFWIGFILSMAGLVLGVKNTITEYRTTAKNESVEI
jgi:hypothetical protein